MIKRKSYLILFFLLIGFPLVAQERAKGFLFWQDSEIDGWNTAYASSTVEGNGSELKSGKKAFILSLLGMAVPVGIGGTYALVCKWSPTCAGDEKLPVSLGALGAGVLLGPSLGYFYAGRPSRGMGGIGIRLAVAAGASAIAGVIWWTTGVECHPFSSCFWRFGPDHTASIVIFAIGGVLVTAHAIYDIVKVKDAVRKGNRAQREKALTVAPAYFPQHGAPGLKLQARF